MSSGERPIGNAKGKQPRPCAKPPLPTPWGWGSLKRSGRRHRHPKEFLFNILPFCSWLGSGRAGGQVGIQQPPPPALLGMGTFLGPWFSEDLGGWVSELPPSPWHGPDLHAESYKRVFHLCRSAFCLHPFDTVSLPLYRS